MVYGGAAADSTHTHAHTTHSHRERFCIGPEEKKNGVGHVTRISFLKHATLTASSENTT